MYSTDMYCFVLSQLKYYKQTHLKPIVSGEEPPPPPPTRVTNADVFADSVPDVSVVNGADQV